MLAKELILLPANINNKILLEFTDDVTMGKVNHQSEFAIIKPRLRSELLPKKHVKVSLVYPFKVHIIVENNINNLN